MSRFHFGLFVLAFVLAGCGGDVEVETDGRPVVYTTFYPTTYFAERIAGDLAEVVCPLPEDADPIFWQPGDDVIRKYQLANLIVVNGAGFEKWVETASLPESIVVDTSASIPEEFIEYQNATTHSHGPEGEHAHEGIDGHTWLDPVNAQVQAGAIHAGLAALLPDHESELKDRFEALNENLEELNTELVRMTKTYGGHAILASHPAYNYLARRYGWNIVNLDLDPEVMPDDETLAEIAETVRETSAKFILWEGEPTAEIAEALSTRCGVKSVLFSPCEAAGDEDYLTTMKANLKRLEPVLRGN